MTRHHPTPVWLAALVPVLLAGRAHAQDCALPPGGEVSCGDLVIDSVVRVAPYDAAQASSTGFLHIRARSITITETGVIDAVGSGHRTRLVGTDPTDGEGLGGGTRGTPANAGGPAPGGGGAHVGPGGRGLLDALSCTLSASAVGGSAYDDPSSPLLLDSPFDALRSLGSAGGASYCGDSGAQLRAGGRGGGVVILTAGTVSLGGRILVDGQGLEELGANWSLCGPGAGAGGAIVVRSHVLTVGPQGLLSATGGESLRTQNGSGDDATNSWGGAGGGGLITVFSDDSVAGLTVDVRGGAAPCVESEGQNGGFATLAASGCVDADLDGFESVVCGGTDCHDGDASIHDGAPEVCDGVDNDCDGAIDEQPDASCPAGSGSVCVDGACEVVAEGDGGSPSTPLGPAIELGGGLCSSGSHPRSRAGWWWLGALGFWWTRRRVTRR